MKQFLITLTALILLPAVAFSQGKMVKHTVKKNETVSEIAEKYNTTSSEIYRLNPDSKKGIKPDTILLVQAKKREEEDRKSSDSKKEKSGKSGKVHVVVSGDSFFSVAKKYGVSTEDIKNANPDVNPSGLQLGTELRIPSDKDSKTPEAADKIEKVVKAEKKEKKEKTPKTDITEKVDQTEKADKKAKVEQTEKAVKGDQVEKSEKVEKTEKKEKVEKTESVKAIKVEKKQEEIFHEVVENDTKFSIAKKYGVTIKDLEDANPEIVNSLPLGLKLKIVPSTLVSGKTYAEPKKSSKFAKTAVTSIKEPITYEVKAKETLYSLTKKFSIHPDALVDMNPELKEGVREGMILKVPGNTVIKEDVVPAKPVVVKPAVNFEKLNTQDRKKLVLLLPFNLSKIEKDSANTVASRLKVDKFLNMTLDFYSGALMAIDSAKTLGMNIDVKIYDSQETRNSSSVASLIQMNGLDKADAVIGPFYQANVEKTADILSKNNVPVISPLSKDLGKTYPNLLQSMPSNEMAKNAMFDYMRNKEGNILAILDPKKISSKMYLTQNHKDVKLVGLDAKNLVVADSVAKRMVKGKINYVILESEKTNMILKTLNVLTALQSQYTIQLVILEKNDALDFEEIPLSKLAKLKLLYPSFTKSNETPEAYVFESEYKAKNKILPNQYATRGFDITFDTMMRLSQEGGLMGNLDKPTEQIESKFNYEKKGDAFANKGIYILHYDGDLSVKQAE